MGSDWLCPEGGSAWVEAKNEPTLGSLFRAPASAPQPPRAATRAAAQTRNQMQDLLTAVRADNGRATDAKPWWKRFKSDAIEREDQESIRDFGPRADKFLPVYDKMQAAKKTYVISWTWPAFFATYSWFFYRKMYLIGAALIGIQTALGFGVGIYGIVAYLAGVAANAKSQYVLMAMRRLDNADALGLVGEKASTIFAGSRAYRWSPACWRDCWC